MMVYYAGYSSNLSKSKWNPGEGELQKTKSSFRIIGKNWNFKMQSDLFYMYILREMRMKWEIKKTY